MTARPAIQPRLMTRPQVGIYLGRSGSWFREHEAALRDAGFPAPHPVLGLFDREAIDDWLDATSGRKVTGAAAEAAAAWN